MSFLRTEGRADLHMHSNYGDGALSIDQILEQAQRLGLTAIAVTDHDNVIPSLEAREKAAKQGLELEIITGEEVTTTGLRHLLALGIEGTLPFGLPLAEAVARIHDQGGLAIAPHPLFWWWAASLKANEILSVPLDGLEIINGAIGNPRAQIFYDEHLSNRYAAVAGSDAHFHTIGKAVTVYEAGEGGVIAAIREKRTGVLDLHVNESVSPTDIILNLYRSMIKEPIRRGRLL